MAAFADAVSLGYRYVETDVQVTADGVLVAFHDNDLRRTCGIRARISDLPWSKVATARVNGEAPIPLLEELLGAWPELRVNIDCKSDAAVDALVGQQLAVGLVHPAARLLGHLFGPEGISVAHAHDPQRFADACLSLLSDAEEQRRLAEHAWDLVVSRFSWRHAAECFERILENGLTA